MRVTSTAIGSNKKEEERERFGVVFLLPAKQCKFSLWFLGIYIYTINSHGRAGLIATVLNFLVAFDHFGYLASILAKTWHTDV
jgi:hypothetical protein